MMPPFQIAVLHSNSISEDTFAEFVRTISTDHLKVDIESREGGGIYAGLEWLIPTAVIIYIGKSYFDGFLKEMGKDHYNLLKAGLKTLREKLLGSTAPQITVLSSKPGKITPNQPYSLVYSIMAEGNGRLRFKLLLQREVSEHDYGEILDAFLEFLAAYHSQSPAESIESFEAPRVSGDTVLLAFNLETKVLEVIHPIALMCQHFSGHKVKLLY